MFLDRNDFYSQRSNRRSPDDPTPNMGTTRLQFRRILLGEDYEIPLEDIEIKALRDKNYKD